jgi:hypothetical protein
MHYLINYVTLVPQIDHDCSATNYLNRVRRIRPYKRWPFRKDHVIVFDNRNMILRSSKITINTMVLRPIMYGIIGMRYDRSCLNEAYQA